MPDAIDLTERLGLPAKLNPVTGEIDFGVSVGKAITRALGKAVERGLVFNASQIHPEKLGIVVTRIYRKLNDERVRGIQRGTLKPGERVKFDVTVLLPYTALDSDWQLEFPKTFGHFHRKFNGFPFGSPDFYQVIHGKARLLLQKVSGREVESYVVEPKELEPVVIPPEYGHTAINIGREPLVFANICIRKPHLDYSNIQRFNGAAYYFLRKRGGGTILQKNRRYEEEGYIVRKPERLKPNLRLPEIGISGSRPIYRYIEDDSPALEMLSRPEKYLDVFRVSLVEPEAPISRAIQPASAFPSQPGPAVGRPDNRLPFS